jgi:hypothetical protein
MKISGLDPKCIEQKFTDVLNANGDDVCSRIIPLEYDACELATAGVPSSIFEIASPKIGVPDWRATEATWVGG